MAIGVAKRTTAGCVWAEVPGRSLVRTSRQPGKKGPLAAVPSLKSGGHAAAAPQSGPPVSAFPERPEPCLALDTVETVDSRLPLSRRARVNMDHYSPASEHDRTRSGRRCNHQSPKYRGRVTGCSVPRVRRGLATPAANPRDGRSVALLAGSPRPRTRTPRRAGNRPRRFGP